jgi:putrescine transport system permease protein
VIFSSVRLGVSPQINALATLFLVAVAVLVTAAGRLMSAAERQRPGEPGPPG